MYANRLAGVLGVAAVVVGLGSTSSLAQEVILYSFESGTENWRGSDAGHAANLAFTTSATGATHGSQALQVTSQGGYRILLGGSFAGDATKASALANASELKIDVTLPADPDVGTDFMQLRPILNYGGPTLAAQWNEGPITDFSGPIYGTRPVTYTATFDLTGAWNQFDNLTVNGNDPSGPSLWWTELGLALNTNGPVNTTRPPTTIYIDNIRVVVPEPLTASALIAGAIVALKRRR